jgi:hypothetical protein
MATETAFHNFIIIGKFLHIAAVYHTTAIDEETALINWSKAFSKDERRGLEVTIFNLTERPYLCGYWKYSGYRFYSDQ